MSQTVTQAPPAVVMIRPRTKPSGSMIHVSGTWNTPNSIENSFSVSYTTGQSPPPYLSKNASTSSGVLFWTGEQILDWYLRAQSGTAAAT